MAINSSFIYNRQKLESLHSNVRRVVKQTTIQPCSEILVGNKQELTAAIPEYVCISKTC